MNKKLITNFEKFKTGCIYFEVKKPIETPEDMNNFLENLEQLNKDE